LTVTFIPVANINSCYYLLSC